MPFIKVQKLKRDDTGKILSGSAAIIDVLYVKEGKNHSKQVVREKLGKVIFLSDDRRSGIFSSPTRGIVRYDADDDMFGPVDSEDPEVSETNIFTDMPVHTVFGDAYLLMNVLKDTALLQAVRTMFPADEEYQRALCHLAHAVLKLKGRIHCDAFVRKSFICCLADMISVDSLDSDTVFFTLMSDDRVKIAFFKCFVTEMRKEHPDFGKGCYVDSTPLPNGIDGNPYNYLCCHGIGDSSIQTRLALVLDSETGYPVWFRLFPGNVLDLNTVKTVCEETFEYLGVSVGSLILDAGYASGELIDTYNIDPCVDDNGKEIGDVEDDDHTLIVRMPSKKGYPFNEMYTKNRMMFNNGKYLFVRNGHTYFGIRRTVNIFGHWIYAYVYVDKENALSGFKGYMDDHDEEFGKLTDREKTWKSTEYGFFVLLSTVKAEPSAILDGYFERTGIEAVFKTSKDWADLLPLAKWSDTTVRGKIMSDIVTTIAILQIRKALAGKKTTFVEVFGNAQSLICVRRDGGKVIVDPPNRQARSAFEAFGLKVPHEVDIAEFRDGVMYI